MPDNLKLYLLNFSKNLSFMNTQECQTDSPEITLGDKFRIAREALHLSLEEVADAIALRPSILKSLEENQFVNAAVPATFMRGYVRNYAKFLRIPESEWTNLVHFGHDQENDLGIFWDFVGEKQYFTESPREQYYSRWKGFFWMVNSEILSDIDLDEQKLGSIDF